TLGTGSGGHVVFDGTNYAGNFGSTASGTGNVIGAGSSVVGDLVSASNTSTTGIVDSNKFAATVASDPRTYGASSAASAATNTTAFVAAMNAAPNVYCPDGVSFTVQQIDIPNTVAHIFGHCTLNPGGTLSTGGNVLSDSGGSNGLLIEDVNIPVDISTFPNVDAININGATNTTIRHTTTSGNYPIFVQSSTNTDIENNAVTTYVSAGITGLTSNIIKINNNTVTGSGATSPTARHCIQIDGGFGIEINDNIASSCNGFGVSLSVSGTTVTQNFVVKGNNISHTISEGINCGDCLFGIIANNVIQHDTYADDFGMSINGDSTNTAQDVLVTGNVLINSWKAGIGVWSYTTNVSIIGNFVYNSNQGNGTTDDFTAGIAIGGGSNTTNFVNGNYVMGVNGSPSYSVHETQSAGATGPTYVGFNYGTQAQLVSGTGSFAGQTCAAGSHVTTNGISTGC
ncbi:MAG: right-handed parallel beta-helix repeat-containing protein, partial [Acidobacteriaceae bacterium]